MNELKRYAVPVSWVALALLLPAIGFCDFDSSVIGLRLKLTGFILPMLSVMGIGFAAISFFTGSPNAKQHIGYAVIGSIIGFGAQSIVDMLSSLVR